MKTTQEEKKLLEEIKQLEDTLRGLVGKNEDLTGDEIDFGLKCMDTLQEKDNQLFSIWNKKFGKG